MRVVSISSSRADVGGLLPVWRALSQSGVALDIVLTGMHCANGASAPTGLPAAARVHRCGADLGGKAVGGAKAMAAILADCGALYERLAPDIVLVLGDRLDLLPAVVATLPANIAVAHVHGGEVTEGAIDDRIRHALTKLAHLHLVSSAHAAARVRAFGEETWRIVDTGAPGLDTLLAAPEMARGEFLAAVGLAPIAGSSAGFRLVTVHPETNGADPLAPLEALLGALIERPMPTLVTAPNSDPGGAAMAEMVMAFVKAHDWAAYVETLGPLLYPNALRHAALMLGNSSSGIIEAGLFGLPVVDIGARQAGRERGRNVHGVANDKAAIAAAEAAILNDGRRIVDSRYGDGRAGPRIAEALLAFGCEPPEKRLSKRATVPLCHA